MNTSQTKTRWSTLEWARRYLAAEVISTVCALLATWIAYQRTEHIALVAVVDTAAGSLSFYAVMLVRSLSGKGLADAPRVIRDLILEFGPAEALDTLLVRPSLIYAGITCCPNPALGALLGALAADICFYVPAIASYEILRCAARPGGRHPAPLHTADPVAVTTGIRRAM